jgi:nitrogen-specific signal transduction histidine kinase
MTQPPADLSARDDALRRAVRLTVVQELADEMAHDLNNVLTVIAGSLQLFLMQQGGETAQHHFIRNAIDASLRGAMMTGNLLAYASPQVAETGVVDLVEVVQNVAPLLRETIGSTKGLEIVPSSDPGAQHLVVADRRFIESALLALGAITAAKSVHNSSFRQMTLRFDRLVGRDAALQSGAVGAQSDVVQLTVCCEAPGLSSDAVRPALTPAFGSVAIDRPTLDLSAAYASVRQCHGDIGVTALSPSDHPTDRDGFVVSILLPAATI